MPESFAASLLCLGSDDAIERFAIEAPSKVSKGRERGEAVEALGSGPLAKHCTTIAPPHHSTATTYALVCTQYVAELVDSYP